jgi:5,10-methylenetetrahydrofolate reductase
VPAWKAKADFLLAQVSYDVDRLLAWRGGLCYDGKLFAGVMVMASS